MTARARARPRAARGSQAERAIAVQLLRQLQRPATASPVERPGHNGRHDSISFNSNKTAWGTAGNQIRKTLLKTGEPVPKEKLLKTREIIAVDEIGPAGQMSGIQRLDAQRSLARFIHG